MTSLIDFSFSKKEFFEKSEKLISYDVKNDA